MKKMLYLCLCVGLLGCDKPEPVIEEPAAVPTLNFSVVPEGNANISILLNESFFVNDSVELKISDFNFYLTNLAVQNELGEWTIIQESWLMSLYENQTGFQVKNEVLRNAKKIRFNIGVPAEINHSDPSQYPNSSAYSIQGGKGMHWGWETGYKFLIIDGKAKLPGDTAFNTNVSLHAGTDTLLRKVEYDIANLNFADVKPPYLVMRVSLSEAFDNIDLSTENQSHTGSDIVTVTKLMNNFVTAIHFAILQE